MKFNATGFAGCDCLCPGCQGLFCAIELKWRAEVSGISDDAGTNCANYNGTHDITINRPTEPGFPWNEGCCHGIIPLGDGKKIKLEICTGYSGFFPDADPDTFVTSVDMDFIDDSSMPEVIEASYFFFAVAPQYAPCSSTGHTLTHSPQGDECTGWPSSLVITSI